MDNIEVIKDLERTQIPYLKKKIFNAETLINQSNNESVVRQARRDLEEYQSQLKNYEQQVQEARSLGLI